MTDDLKDFETTEGEWETLAEQRSRWHECASQGVKMFMSAWEDNELEVALTRHARQAEKRVSFLLRPYPLKV